MEDDLRRTGTRRAKNGDEGGEFVGEVELVLIAATEDEEVEGMLVGRAPRDREGDDSECCWCRCDKEPVGDR